MRYLLLIYEDEKYYEEATPEDWEKTMVAHNAFGAEALLAGVPEPGGGSGRTGHGAWRRCPATHGNGQDRSLRGW